MRAIGILAIMIGGLFLGLNPASARPRQIIILRHAEKTDGPDLCPTGVQRAEALATQYYLGKSVQRSLFERMSRMRSTRSPAIRLKLSS